MADARRNLILTILGVNAASPAIKEVGDDADDAGRKVEAASNRSVKAMAGVVGAAAASSAAVGAVTAALPVLFIAAGAAALSSNTQVRQSYSDLFETMRTGMAEDAAPMRDELVGAAEDIGSAYSQLRPQLQQAFVQAAPHVRTLTGGVLEFATRAVPGMISVLERADPVVEGLTDTLTILGDTTGEFLAIVSEGSPQAGAGLRHIAAVVDQTLPGMGHLLVMLSGLWAEHGAQIADVMGQLTDTAVALGGSALPIVSDSLGSTLDLLQGVLTVLGPVADKLGPLIGVWLSMSIAMRTVGAARGVIDNVTGSFADFRTQAARAGGPEGTGRFAAGARGVMGLLGGPWGIAITAGITLLTLFGKQSQATASDQRSLASALQESGGAFTGNVIRTIANSDGYRKIAGTVEAAGLSHEQYIRALIEGGPALDAVTSRLKAQATAGTELVAGGQGMVEVETDQARASKELMLATDGLRGTVVGAVEDYQRMISTIGQASDVFTAQVPGTDAFREAITILGNQTAETAEHVDALETAWRHLFGIELDLEEATAEFEAGLDQLRDSVTEVKDGTASWRGELFAAGGAINLTTDSGRELQRNLVSQGEAYRQLGQTTFDTARRQGLSQQEATNVTIDAARRRRAQFEAEMSALGFTAAQVKMLADRYIGLPDQVMTTIRADVGSAQRVVNKFITDNNGRTIAINIRGQQVGQKFLASGGPALAGELYTVGEDGPELFVPNEDGTVIPTDMTRRILNELAAVRNGGTSTGGAPASVTTGPLAAAAHAAPAVSSVTNNNFFSGPIGNRRELQDWFVRMYDDLRRAGRI